MGKASSQPATSTPEWRKIPWGDKEKCVQYLKDYKPFKKDFKQLRILLHGPGGSGKSSFINSIDTILQGRTTSQALADTVTGESFTKTYETYKIQKEEPAIFYPFVFSDIMGPESYTNREICVEDIKLAIRGHMKDKYKFKPDSALSQNDPDYNHTPSINDKCDILVYVIPATTCNLISSEIIQNMRETRLAARYLGIPQVAILTKIDEAWPEVKEDLRNVYKSSYVKEQMEKLSSSVGFPLNCVFPVKNYQSEVDTDDDTDVLILSVLRRIILYAEACLWPVYC